MVVSIEETRERIQRAIRRREAQGQRVAEIAAELGVSVPTIYRWRRGLWDRIDPTLIAAVTLITEQPDQAA